nr:hypothetical protein JVH1_5485 [Rhodococcus sp. JVH1]
MPGPAQGSAHRDPAIRFPDPALLATRPHRLRAVESPETVDEVHLTWGRGTDQPCG